MNIVIENINSYFINMYGKYRDFDLEVESMVKSFYDPRVAEKGRQKGIEEGIEKIAVNMIKKGKNIEEIMELTELSYEKIIELKGKYQN